MPGRRRRQARRGAAQVLDEGTAGDACHDDPVHHTAGMSLAKMLAMRNAVHSIGCRYRVEGGWGIDAAVGRQTRPHRDVDLDIDGAFEDEVLAALADLGYVIETDWRPNRVELVAPDWVGSMCIHWSSTRTAMPGQAALGGGWHEFPCSFFTTGTSATWQRRRRGLALNGRRERCG
jgi:lincosamide nucleotidyltransferase A/C/D/E